MRQLFNLNQGWIFSNRVPENISDPLQKYIQVNLPFTWSARGEGAYKGKCIYRKELPVPAELNAIRLFLEFKGVSNVCLVYINDKCVDIHKGGFTAFRVEITAAVEFGKTNIISVVADNSDYSAMCRLLPDSEFFGGIWGDVNLIIAGVTHFALDDSGSDGIYINTKVSDGVGKVAVHARISNPVNYDIVSFTVYDAAGGRIGAAAAHPKDANVILDIENPVLWRPGKEKAYLYKLKVKLLRDGVILDERETDFGFRRVQVDAENGFTVNGRKIRVKGVTWGQDDVKPKNDFTVDIHNIEEMGANAVRLLNYYQSEKFFELCDKRGIMLWCELPLVLDSVNEDSLDNLVEQYVELAKQYYNHPSVCFVAVDGGDTPEGRAAENKVFDAISAFDINRIRVSPDYINHFDAEKPETNAAACGCKICEDAQSDGFAAAVDRFHVAEPERTLFITEYGVAGDVAYHSETPQKGDFSEEYQAKYHEDSWNAIARRDFIAGSFAAELYDADVFAGGLIARDGAVKKDAYWFYKSQWSDDKFVKIAGERFKNRTEKKISLKIYSNCHAVTLTVNGKAAKNATMVGANGVFVIDDVKLIRGDNVIRAETDDGCVDEIVIRRVKNADKSYVYGETAVE